MKKIKILNYIILFLLIGNYFYYRIYLSKPNSDSINIISNFNGSPIINSKGMNSMKIFFRKPTSWSKVYIHYWGTIPDKLETKWPGVPMKQEKNSWYSFTLPDQVRLNAVFNNNSKPQTENYLNLTDGMKIQEPELPGYVNRFLYPEGKTKALIMSFDDGSIQDRRLVSIFNRNNIKGTFHINSGKLGQNNYITKEELKSLYINHEVSAHTVNHPHLYSLSLDDLNYEIGVDQKTLSEIIGYTVTSMSYPFGDCNDKIIRLIPKYNIECARIVPSTYNFTLPVNLYKWKATCHHSEAQEMVEKYLKLSPVNMTLLFIWGHSWELDSDKQNNNWKYIKNICNKIGNHNDFWYTTMSEMTKYIRAIYKVEIINNNKIINHSNISLWIKDKNKVYEIQSGKSINLSESI
jgi:peptidoglycan/xylan/chitin deacetylase (PgdA/CDA1 family)